MPQNIEIALSELQRVIGSTSLGELNRQEFRRASILALRERGDYNAMDLAAKLETGNPNFQPVVIDYVS